MTPDLDLPREDRPRAIRRPGLVALAYGYRLLAGLLIALPAAVAVGGPTQTWPRAQAELFDPGAVMLVESLRLARRALETASVSAVAVAALAMLGGVLPLGALLAALDRKGRVSVGFLADRAWRLAGTLALLFVVAALAQAAAGAVLVLLGGKLIGALGLWGPADDLAFVVLFAAALGAVLAVGVLRDLASASAVRAGLRFYDASARGIRSARKAGRLALGAWAWRSALGTLGLGLAAWAAPSLTGASKGAVALGVLVHQMALLGATFARASWLAAAMRIHDRTEPVALPVPEPPEPEPEPPAPVEAEPEAPPPTGD